VRGDSEKGRKKTTLQRKGRHVPLAKCPGGRSKRYIGGLEEVQPTKGKGKTTLRTSCLTHIGGKKQRGPRSNSPETRFVGKLDLWGGECKRGKGNKACEKKGSCLEKIELCMSLRDYTKTNRKTGSLDAGIPNYPKLLYSRRNCGVWNRCRLYEKTGLQIIQVSPVDNRKKPPAQYELFKQFWKKQETGRDCPRGNKGYVRGHPERPCRESCKPE